MLTLTACVVAFLITMAAVTLLGAFMLICWAYLTLSDMIFKFVNIE